MEKRYQDAYETYEQEFTKYYGNPFGILGMIQALQGLGRDETEIESWLKKFESQTANADVAITSSCIMFDFKKEIRAKYVKK